MGLCVLGVWIGVLLRLCVGVWGWFFFFEQETAYGVVRSLVGLGMCIRASCLRFPSATTSCMVPKSDWPGVKWSKRLQKNKSSLLRNKPMHTILSWNLRMVTILKLVNEAYNYQVVKSKAPLNVFYYDAAGVATFVTGYHSLNLMSRSQGERSMGVND